jgi:tetratricopeptide (TPR) repeat protein
MRAVMAWAGIVSCVATAGVAAASEQSQLLSSRGLVEFHAERFPAALDLFDRALSADPTDVYARYYRGVTRSRLDDTAGAIADLRAALAAKPDFPQAALDLGIALVQTGQYREAIPWLQQAQAVSDLDGQASLFLGIAQLRLGEPGAAQANFERAEARDPKQRLAARYYLGVAAYQRGQLRASQEQFTYVAQASPGTEMGREATTFLERIRTTQAHAQYQAYAALGFQYDSNVPLLNDTITALPGINNQQSDGATLISFGGTYVPWHNDSVALLLGYDFFQSLHFSLSDFNLQDNGPSLQVAVDLGRVKGGILGRYDYYLLETNSFLQEGTALPWLTVPEADFGRSEVYSRIRRRDFKNAAYDVLNSFDYAAGVRQVVYVTSPDRSVSLGYQFDKNDPIVDDNQPFGSSSYGYDGNEVSIGGGWLLPQSITAGATFAYRHNRYDFVASDGRKDDEYLVTTTLSRPMTEHLNLTLAYLGDYNNSNESLFDYDRSIVSVTMEVRF